MEKNVWEKSWLKSKPTYTLGFVSNLGYRLSKGNIQKILLELELSKKSKILDVGCGEGRTLTYFREIGFNNLIGIDTSISALKLCEGRGFKISKDVFIMDASNTTFKDNEFDLVFAEGFLEHFKNVEPFVKEISRVCKKYILLIQPNHFSIFGKILNFIMENFSRSHVKEYDYRINDFIYFFNNFGFELKFVRGSHINLPIDTSNIILFEKGKNV